MSARLAVVVSGWPRVSETFAQHELLALQRAGMLAAVFATKDGDHALRQPGSESLDGLVEVLPAGGVATQAAAVVAGLHDRRVDGVHGYFAHRPAAVAATAARSLDVPYGFSAHALDVRKVPAPDLAARVAGAAVVVSCNADTTAALAAVGGRAQEVPHGVDVDRFGACPAASAVHGNRLEILAVGRLVAKKGFDVLIEAVALVARRHPVALRIVGDGPERPHLRARIVALGLQDRVELVGRRTHAELPALYASADVVVVPSVVDHRGDRDGLPNVVLEAMASARPVVASGVAAIATAVHHGTTGLVVPPGDARALARAIGALADDPACRHRLGLAGRAEVASRFDLRRCTTELCRTLGASYA